MPKMIKHQGKFVPAKEVEGKLVPDLDSKLVLTADGMKVVSDGEPAPAPEAAPTESPAPEAPPEEEKKGFLDKLMGR